MWVLMTAFLVWNIRHMRRKSRAFLRSALQRWFVFVDFLWTDFCIYSDTCMRTKKSAISYLVLASLMWEVRSEGNVRYILPRSETKKLLHRRISKRCLDTSTCRARWSNCPPFWNLSPLHAWWKQLHQSHATFPGAPVSFTSKSCLLYY